MSRGNSEDRSEGYCFAADVGISSQCVHDTHAECIYHYKFRCDMRHLSRSSNLQGPARAMRHAAPVQGDMPDDQCL